MTGGYGEGLDRSDVERLVTIETILRDMTSRLASLNQDMNADSKILNTVKGDIHRLTFELTSERHARAELNHRIAALDADVRTSLTEMRLAVAGNTNFRRDLMVGAGVGGTVVGSIAALGAWLMGYGPAIMAWLRGGA